MRCCSRSRLRLLARVLLASAAFLLAAASPAAAGVLFGFNENWSEAGHDIAAARPFRPTAQRFHLNWSLIEPVKGARDWQAADLTYRKIVGQGAAPIALVVAAPCWAATGGACSATRIQPVAPGSYPEWERFVQAAVARYPRLAALEVWNEPNLAAFFHPRPDAASYVETLRHAYVASKAVRPALPVLGGSLAPITTPARAARDGGFARNRPDKRGFAPFLKRMYRLGAGRYMDALAFHPYPNFAPYLKARKLGAGVRRGFARGIARDIAKQVRTVRRIARRHGAAGSIWATETGACTTGPRERRTSPTEQALAIRHTYLTLRRLRVRAILMHRLWDIRYPGTPVDNIENGCGLMDMSGRRKPAWDALRALRAPKAARRSARRRR